MLALVTDPECADGLKLAEIDEPRPARNEALIAVHATSLNRGELRLLKLRPKGWIPGQDVAGIVERAAADGSGPAAGERVAALSDENGWAQRVAVPTDRIAVMPQGLDFARAATLPVAGITALRTVRLGGDVTDRRVLVTGASGAVGRLQIQITRQQGASVCAVAAARHADDLRRLGAAQVVASVEEAEGPFALITESVGGESLARAIERVAPGGTIVMFGSSSGEPTSIGFRQFVPGREGARLQTFAYYASGPGIDEDLASWLRWLAAGRVEARIAATLSWRNVGEGLDALRQRRADGKVVLIIAE